MILNVNTWEMCELDKLSVKERLNFDSCDISVNINHCSFIDVQRTSVGDLFLPTKDQLLSRLKTLGSLRAILYKIQVGYIPLVVSLYEIYVILFLQGI